MKFHTTIEHIRSFGFAQDDKVEQKLYQTTANLTLLASVVLYIFT